MFAMIYGVGFLLLGSALLISGRVLKSYLHQSENQCETGELAITELQIASVLTGLIMLWGVVLIGHALVWEI
jgi:hypothetical protein